MLSSRLPLLKCGLNSATLCIPVPYTLSEQQTIEYIYIYIRVFRTNKTYAYIRVYNNPKYIYVGLLGIETTVVSVVTNGVATEFMC